MLPLVRCCCASIIATTVLVPSTNSAERSAALPVIYNFVSKGSDPAIQQAFKRAYSGKFRVVDFSDKKSYLPSKCTNPIVPKPQRDSSGHVLHGSVLVGLIVTTQGTVMSPFIINSDNHVLDPVVLATIKQWRGTPAQLNGSRIAITRTQKITFKANR
jgi:TonB family protein